MELLGIFSNLESAASAVDGLVRAGFTEAQITSLTSTPCPDGVLVKTDQRTWFRWFTLACGIAGAGAGFLLAAGTAWVYPVQTGDKPIIAFYPTGIVTYEFTMLFFLVGTIVGMFLEMRLPPAEKRLYAPEISEGRIGICIAIHPGGEAVACGEGVGPAECVGPVASLSAGEQKSLARKIMREAEALRIVEEATS
ncbi:MAG TPA: quinol:electron acceptor oxidoreductase subunit ActD [Geobacteraceae bacterium]|nr:quinol:electron acceptor oxidoreductase subunit ActD [Geobacteraceae bacterium]